MCQDHEHTHQSINVSFYKRQEQDTTKTWNGNRALGTDPDKNGLE